MMVLSTEEKRKNNGLTCMEKPCSTESERKRGEKEYIKRTKSTSVFADIDLAPCVNPVNTILLDLLS